MAWEVLRDGQGSINAILERAKKEGVMPRDTAVEKGDVGKKDNADGPGFVVRSPLYSLNRIVLEEKTKAALRTVISRIRNHDFLYNSWGLRHVDPYGAHKSVNLYGPPGTGKSMCGEALAAELGMPMIDVDYAEIESKYVGETPKRIRAAFQAAAEHQAMMFFDEADSILGRRMTEVTQAADQAVNVSRAVMLKELDRFQGVVVFATNLARNFDSAFVRRIFLHVEIPLPDRSSRLEIWRRMVPEEVDGRNQLGWESLAERTDGFSGGDIKNAAIAAMAEAVARQGTQRRVAQGDFDRAIDLIHRGKANVGHLLEDGPGGVINSMFETSVA